MIKMIKMDLYRFFRSATTWIILFLTAILAFLSVVLVRTIISNTAITNSATPIRTYSNVGELLAAQINGGMLMALCAITVIIFTSAKYQNGFIKNIINLLPRRELLVFPEIIVTFIACALHFFAYSICTIASGAIFLGNAFIAFSFLDIIKLLIVQFILHWSFCCLLLLFYMLTNSTTATMIIGLLISFKILNLFYAFVEQFIHFNMAQYMLDSNIFQVGLQSAKLIYTRAVIVGLIFLLGEIGLLCAVMRKKDIK